MRGNSPAGEQAGGTVVGAGLAWFDVFMVSRPARARRNSLSHEAMKAQGRSQPRPPGAQKGVVRIANMMKIRGGVS